LRQRLAVDLSTTMALTGTTPSVQAAHLLRYRDYLVKRLLLLVVVVDPTVTTTMAAAVALVVCAGLVNL